MKKQVFILSSQSIVAFVAAILITFFLFYIDEGYYNLNFLRDPLNIMWFAVYVLWIWGAQLLLARFCFNTYKMWEKMMLNTLFGIPLGAISLISIFIGLTYFLS
jgi:hypothetical protein